MVELETIDHKSFWKTLSPKHTIENVPVIEKWFCLEKEIRSSFDFDIDIDRAIGIWF